MSSEYQPASGRLVAGLREHAGKVAWLLVEKTVLLASGVIVGFWVVRSLGPEQFGRFSAALSVTAVLAGLATMGLETTVLRRLAARSAAPERIVASAAALRLAGTCVYILASWLASHLLFAQDREIALVALVVAGAAVFQVSDLVGLRFQAENRYRDASLVRIAARAAGDTLRVFLIFEQASIHWFAAALVFESAVACALFAFFGRAVLRAGLVPAAGLVRSLFGDGRPVVISAILAALYARLDQIVLYNLWGAADTGRYAAAVRVSEVFNVLIVSIATVAAAAFGRAQALDEAKFDAMLLTYYRSMLAVGFAISLLLCVSAEPTIRLLYGESFQGAAPILRVHAWTVLLVFASSALEPWFYHHAKLNYYVWKTLTALLFAVPAIYFGSLLWGPVGTAAAVVATYFVSVVVSNALLPAIQPAFAFQRRAVASLFGAGR